MPTRYGSFNWIVSITLLMIASVLILSRSNVFAADGAAQLTPTSNNLNAEQLIAQDFALSNSEVAKLLNGNRAEVFHILNVTEHFASCNQGKCLQANIYDYDANTMISVIVDVVNKQVVDVFDLPGSQPSNLNARLDTLARNAVASSVDVKEALGFSPDPDDVLMMQANHLESANCLGANVCAAAVFLVDGGVVWVMYDATNEQIDKIWWDSRPLSVAEKDVFRRQPSDEFLANVPTDCGTSISVDQDGWTFDYETTDTDGLRLNDIRFNGTLVMTAASLVEWHADYGPWGYKDSIGCDDVQGLFPIYPFGDTEVADLLDDNGTQIGFEVIQDFRMGNWGVTCNYRYEQHFQFFSDGRWRIVSGAYGEGCGNNQDDEAIYRAIWRLDIAIDDAANDRLETWGGGAWQTVSDEGWFLQDNQPSTPEGYQYRIFDPTTGNGYYIEPGVGQYDDAGTGDNAYLFVTQYDVAEGGTDLAQLPNTTAFHDDHRQGPHQFVDAGSSVNGEDIVLWYVPQSTTVTLWEFNQSGTEPYCWTESQLITWPCFSGPMFHPINIPPTAVGLDSANASQAQTPYLLVFSVAALLVTVSGVVLVSRRNG